MDTDFDGTTAGAVVFDEAPVDAFVVDDEGVFADDEEDEDEDEDEDDVDGNPNGLLSDPL